MKIACKPPVHLTYCLNVHPGESWAENYAAIRTKAQAIRKRVSADKPFGLGLRLGRQAADTLLHAENLAAFKAFLDENGFYVFTINGFPYGSFHGKRVKESVYRPDWRSSDRLVYTLQLADILAALLPDGQTGSISTLPGSYKAWITGLEDRQAVVDNLVRCVSGLHDLAVRTGKTVHLGLEPEPDCLLETTQETVTFFREDIGCGGAAHLARMRGCSRSEAVEMIRRHLGVCFDTCHMALQYENLQESLATLERERIRVSKVQVSAALSTTCEAANLESLKVFGDSIYLHQVKARGPEGNVVSRGDLPAAIMGADLKDPEEWRIHCHVPLYFQGEGGIGTTATELTPALFAAAASAGAEHFEIETYTFEILPKAMKEQRIEDSVCREYAWARERFITG